jgi:moderate conductance mechanosensitive channel
MDEVGVIEYRNIEFSAVADLNVASVAESLGADRLVRWLSLQGLSIVLWVTGALLAARFVQWSVVRMADHYDEQFMESDALVRSETIKHRQSVAQVVAWVAYATIYVVAAFAILRNVGLPVTSFVAPATVLGAALGFGAQRVVQDLLSGFFIITEKQYGFGDVVSLALTGSSEPADGTVEDVTLRVTKIRSSDGEMITVPNGQIVKAINLSKDWARSVLDVPVPIGTDVSVVNEILERVGAHAFADPLMSRLLLDEPTVMGVTQLEVDTLTVRVVARTLPGKQFDVSRDLRSRIVTAFRDAGISVAPDAVVDTDN